MKDSVSGRANGSVGRMAQWGQLEISKCSTDICQATSPSNAHPPTFFPLFSFSLKGPCDTGSGGNSEGPLLPGSAGEPRVPVCQMIPLGQRFGDSS